MTTDEQPSDGEEAEGPGEPGLTGFPGVDFAGLALGGFGGIGGLGEFIGEARGHFEQASTEAASVVVTGRAGDGSVEIQLTGNLEAISVKIAPEVVDPSDVSMLEDLVLAALRHALAEAVEVQESAAANFLPNGIGGLDLGAMMSGLLGGAIPGAGGAGGGLGGLGGLPDLGELFGLLGGVYEEPDEGDEPAEEPGGEQADDGEHEGGRS
jgi:DNA-binding YbaB/EbfC family protein